MFKMREACSVYDTTFIVKDKKIPMTGICLHACPEAYDWFKENSRSVENVGGGIFYEDGMIWFGKNK